MSKVVNITQNQFGRDYVIGDIHGCFSRVEARLEELGFDRSRDRLFCVGDLVNKGPSSDKVVDFLCNPWFRSLMGNHDALIAQGALRKLAGTFGERSIDIDTLMDNGGEWIIQKSRDELSDLAMWLCGLPMVIQYFSKDGELLAGMIHAELDEELSWSELIEIAEGLPYDYTYSHDAPGVRGIHNLMWGRTKFQSYRCQVKTDDYRDEWYESRGVPLLICGHNIVKSVDSLPFRMVNNLLIDHGICVNSQRPVVIYELEKLLS